MGGHVVVFRGVYALFLTFLWSSSPKTAKQSAQLAQGVPALPGGSCPGRAAGPPEVSFWEKKRKPWGFLELSNEKKFRVRLFLPRLEFPRKP